jgi:hypothetical protein
VAIGNPSPNFHPTVGEGLSAVNRRAAKRRSLSAQENYSAISVIPSPRQRIFSSAIPSKALHGSSFGPLQRYAPVATL